MIPKKPNFLIFLEKMFGLAVEGIHFLSSKYTKSITNLTTEIEIMSSLIQYYLQFIVVLTIFLDFAVSKRELKKQVHATRGMFRFIPDEVFVKNRFLRQLVLNDKKAIRQLDMTKNRTRKIFKNRGKLKSQKD